VPWSERSRSVRPLIFPSSDEESMEARPPSWLAVAMERSRASMRPPSFIPVRTRPRAQSTGFPKLDPSRFANSASPMAASLRAPALPREARPTTHSGGQSGAPSRIPAEIEDAELVEEDKRDSSPEMPPPPRDDAPPHPSVAPAARAQLEAGRAALREAIAATQREREELEAERARFAEAAAALATERARLARVLEGELIDLAVLMAEAIVGTIDDDELPVRIAREGLALLPGCQRATLRAGSGAYEAIVAEFGVSFERDGVRIRVEADDALEGPGCLLEAPEVRIDARVRERLAMAGRAMHELRAGGEEEQE